MRFSHVFQSGFALIPLCCCVLPVAPSPARFLWMNRVDALCIAALPCCTELQCHVLAHSDLATLGDPCGHLAPCGICAAHTCSKTWPCQSEGRYHFPGYFRSLSSHRFLLLANQRLGVSGLLPSSASATKYLGDHQQVNEPCWLASATLYL